MLTGAYSTRFKTYEKSHVAHLKETQAEERSELHMRNKRLQSETNRRRKALAIKRRVEIQKEEKRRRDILTNRKQQIREATEKYQRLNRYYSPKDYEDGSPPSYTPTLDEALNAVRGGSAPVNLRSGSDSMLGARGAHVNGGVRGSVRVTPQGKPRAASAGMARTPVATATYDSSHYGNNAQDRSDNSKADITKYSAYPNSATYIMSHDYNKPGRVQTAMLHDHSLRNLTNSRSLFEQQLQQHQQHLVAQQQASLSHFNKAIQQEMDQDRKLQGLEDIEVSMAADPKAVTPTSVNVSDTVSSLDSLENGRGRDSQNRQVVTKAMVSSIHTQNGASDKTQSTGVPANSAVTQTLSSPGAYTSVTYTSNQPSAFYSNPGATSSSSAGFVLHRNVAVVSPSVIHQEPTTTSAAYGNGIAMATVPPLGDVKTNPDMEGPSNPGDFSYGQTENGTKAAMAYNGQVTQDSRVQFLIGSDAITPSHFQNGNMPHDHAKGREETNLKGGNLSHVDPTVSDVKSWASPVAHKGLLEHSNNSSGVHSDNSAKWSGHQEPASGPRPVRKDSQMAGVTYSTTNRAPVAAVPAPESKWRPVVTQGSVPASVTSHQVSAPSRYGTMAPSSGYQLRPGDDRDDQNSIQSESSQMSDGVAKESKPEPPTAVKGILKKSSSFSGPLDLVVKNSGPTQHGGYPRTILRRSQSASSRLRDSVEITRDRGSKVKHQKKKSVRFADLFYEEEEEGGSESDSGQDSIKNVPAVANHRPPVSAPASQQPAINSKPKPSDPGMAAKPPRPVSAKVTIPTRAEPSPSKIPRSASAGTARRGPFMRPQPPSHPPTGRATMANNHYGNQAQGGIANHSTGYSAHSANHSIGYSGSANHSTGHSTSTTQGLVRLGQRNTQYESSGNLTKPTPTTNGNYQMKTEVPASQGSHVSPQRAEIDLRKSVEAVYDANGIRLDRTPTDDEINWLWDKVRTCLSRNSTSESMANNADSVSASMAVNKQAPTVSQKFIDGSSLAPQHRVSTRVNSTYTNNYMASPASAVVPSNHAPAKKRVTMDTLNTYTRQASLLNQRKQGAADGGTIYHHGNTTQANLHSVQHTEPVYSTTDPSSRHGNQHHGNQPGNGVTESLAAFMTAEDLAKQSATDSEIEHAMEHSRAKQLAYNTQQPANRAPTTLSIEEQRLKQSLERLNERLRLTETSMYPTTVYTPKPPSHLPSYAGFKGNKPLSAGRRHVTANGTVSRQYFRTGSAINSQQPNSHYRYR